MSQNRGSIYRIRQWSETVCRRGCIFGISIWLLAGLAEFACAQESIPGKPIICYKDSLHTALATYSTRPSSHLRLQATFATFETTYVGFPTEAKTAFQHATNIWASYIQSPVPIRITATWASLPPTVLAETRAKRLYRNFPGAVQADVWYPIALAEKIIGNDLNDKSEADIEITVNQNINWYANADGKPTLGQVDLVTVILHEITHGLGFISFADAIGTKGILKDEGYYLIYDVLLENANHVRLSSLPDSSQALYNQLTSNQVYLHSPTAAQSMNGLFPKVYAPQFFVQGASIAHLDNSSRGAQEENSLMFPQIAMGEAIHTPGPTVLGILEDIGWKEGTYKPDAIVVFPNPSKGIFRLLLPINVQSIQIDLVDITGKTIRHMDTVWVGSNPQLDLSYLPNGIYGLTISTSQRKYRQKIILLK